jgi:hypothetical protein
MIQEFFEALSRIQVLKNRQCWKEAGVALDAEFQRLVGRGPEMVATLSQTELLATLLRGEPTQVVRDKALMFLTLLKEAGDVATAEGRVAEGRLQYLKGLELLLEMLAQGDLSEAPDFVPRVEVFLTALGDQPLPLSTLGRLMQHYELAGEFGTAEDMLFTMLEAAPGEAGVRELGLSFYNRLKGRSDQALEEGNLPRTELEAGLAELSRGAGA